MKPKTPRRDPKTGRFLPKPTNVWNDTEMLKRKDFHISQIGELGMSPAESFVETLWCHRFVEVFNRGSVKSLAIHHIRIDSKGLKTPDVSIWELDATGQPTRKRHVVIEVEHSRSKSLARHLCRHAIINHKIKEAFVYLVNKNSWERFTPDNVHDKEGDPTAYSAVLKQHLDEL